MTYVRKRPRYTRARLAQWLHYYVFSMEGPGFDSNVRHNYKNTKGGADGVRLIYKNMCRQVVALSDRIAYHLYLISSI